MEILECKFYSLERDWYINIGMAAEDLILIPHLNLALLYSQYSNIDLYEWIKTMTYV